MLKVNSRLLQENFSYRSLSFQRLNIKVVFIILKTKKSFIGNLYKTNNESKRQETLDTTQLNCLKV